MGIKIHEVLINFQHDAKEKTLNWSVSAVSQVLGINCGMKHKALILLSPFLLASFTHKLIILIVGIMLYGFLDAWTAPYF